MQQRKRLIATVLTGLLILLLLSSGWLLAEGGFAIPWWTTDGGGGHSEGGNFAVTGTMGQPDAGRMTDGTFTINGGFWHGAGGILPPPPAPNYPIYLPLITR